MMTPLHQLGSWIRALLSSIPMTMIRWAVVLALLGMVVWVLMLPSSMTSPPGGARRWDEQLKIWAVLALVIQIAIYWLFA